MSVPPSSTTTTPTNSTSTNTESPYAVIVRPEQPQQHEEEHQPFNNNNKEQSQPAWTGILLSIKKKQQQQLPKGEGVQQLAEEREKNVFVLSFENGKYFQVEKSLTEPLTIDKLNDLKSSLSTPSFLRAKAFLVSKTLPEGMKIPGFTPGNSKSSPNGSTQNEKKQPQFKNTESSKENKQHDLDKKSNTASIPPSLSNPKELEKKSIKSEFQKSEKIPKQSPTTIAKPNNNNNLNANSTKSRQKSLENNSMQHERDLSVSSGSDSSSSEFDEEEDKNNFFSLLYSAFEVYGSQFSDDGPTFEINGQEVDLYKFNTLLKAYGGERKVSKQLLWPNILNDLGFDQNDKKGELVLKKAYETAIKVFEKFMKSIGNNIRTSMNSSKDLSRSRRRSSLQSNLQTPKISKKRRSTEPPAKEDSPSPKKPNLKSTSALNASQNSISTQTNAIVADNKKSSVVKSEQVTKLEPGLATKKLQTSKASTSPQKTPSKNDHQKASPTISAQFNPPRYTKLANDENTIFSNRIGDKNSTNDSLNIKAEYDKLLDISELTRDGQMTPKDAYYQRMGESAKIHKDLKLELKQLEKQQQKQEQII